MKNLVAIPVLVVVLAYLAPVSLGICDDSWGKWELDPAAKAHEKSVANDKAQERAQAEETWRYVIKSVDYAVQMGDTHCQVNYEVSRFPQIRQRLEAKGYGFRMIGLSLVEVSW